MFFGNIKLRRDEKVFAVVHRYCLTLFWYFFFGLLFLSGGFFLIFWLFQYGRWGIAGFLSLLCIGFYLLVYGFYVWRKDRFIVTDQRVVDIHKKGMLEKDITEVFYEDVQDVSGKIKGLWGTVFGYGQISIFLKGSGIAVDVMNVRRPIHLQQKINYLKKKRKNYLGLNLSGNLFDGISEKLKDLSLNDLIKLKKKIKKIIEER